MLLLAHGFSSIVICYGLAWTVPFWTVHPDRTGQDPYHVSTLRVLLVRIISRCKLTETFPYFGTIIERRSGTRKSRHPLPYRRASSQADFPVPTPGPLFVFVPSQGLAFSVKKGVAVPPSLRNMYKELENEYSGEFKAPKHG